MYSLSAEYRICNEQLSKHLCTRLVEGDHNSIIDSLRDTISQNNGVALLDAIYDLLMPCHTAQILTLLSDLGTIRHKNKETMASLHARLHNVFKRICRLGYKTVEQLFVAYSQLAVFNRHYKSHNPVRNERIKVDHKQFDLMSYKTPRAFTDQTRFQNMTCRLPTMNSHQLLRLSPNLDCPSFIESSRRCGWQ